MLTELPVGNRVESGNRVGRRPSLTPCRQR
jgi:hypothetical protein